MNKKTIVLSTLSCFLLLGGCGAQQTKPTIVHNTNTTTVSKQTAVKKVADPSIDQSTINQLYPGWTLKKTQVVHFTQSNVVILGLAKGTTNGDITRYTNGKVVIVQYDDSSKKWNIKWSGNILTDEQYPFAGFDSISVIQSDSQKRAIALVTAECGGSTGYGQAFVLTMDEEGNYELQDTYNVNAMNVEQQGNTLLLNGDQQFGTHKFSFQGDQFTETAIKASDLAPADAVKVFFTLDSNNNVVLQGSNTITMHVGQTIAFVPADDFTKDMFNTGDIAIFSDAWNNDSNYPVAPSDADRLWQGNSVKFDKAETAHFLMGESDNLQKFEDVNSPPSPTLTVLVQP